MSKAVVLPDLVRVDVPKLRLSRIAKVKRVPEDISAVERELRKVARGFKRAEFIEMKQKSYRVGGGMTAGVSAGAKEMGMGSGCFRRMPTKSSWD